MFSTATLKATDTDNGIFEIQGIDKLVTNMNFTELIVGLKLIYSVRKHELALRQVGSGQHLMDKGRRSWTP